MRHTGEKGAVGFGTPGRTPGAVVLGAGQAPQGLPRFTRQQRVLGPGRESAEAGAAGALFHQRRPKPQTSGAASAPPDGDRHFTVTELGSFVSMRTRVIFPLARYSSSRKALSPSSSNSTSIS